ncbi:MAG: Na+/H+ antiporter NhaA [Acidimicrobiia bacterium]|nr:Na+/H+ antiporter NhaA [Acidimicrobiia bacterium]
MVRFLAQETASGILLLIATAAALIWANLPGEWGESYHVLWETHVEMNLGSWVVIDKSLEAMVNDALMVLFFFVVGLEIKSELVVGDLSSRRVAALPAVAALGGMVAPALIFLMVTAGSEGSNGWGVPMATDIAFAVGVLALLGPSIPQALKLFLLTLAIVDDIGAILVIAAFYTRELKFTWLAAAIALWVLVVVLTRYKVWFTPVYAVIGAVLWYAMFRSGVHATIAGVALGLAAPARPLIGHRRFESVEDILSGETADPAIYRDARWRVRESVAVTNRLILVLSPWTSFVVIPIFALANAGIHLSTDSVSNLWSSPVSLGVVFGLVVGKPLGVTAAVWLALKLNLASLPNGLTMRHVLGGGAVAGIGFTVALFIARLAFVDAAGRPTDLLDEAVIGILAASVLASIIGWLILRDAAPQTPIVPDDDSDPVMAEAAAP